MTMTDGYSGVKPAWMQRKIMEMNSLIEAAKEVLERIEQLPEYAPDLTEEDEENIGGHTAEFSYLAKLLRNALNEVE